MCKYQLPQVRNYYMIEKLIKVALTNSASYYPSKKASQILRERERPNWWIFFRKHTKQNSHLQETQKKQDHKKERPNSNCHEK